MKEKKPIFKRWWFWVLLILIVGGLAAGGGDDDESSESARVESTNNGSKEDAKAEDTEKKEEKKEEPAIEYTDIDIATMLNDLESNAMVATDTYKGNYYAISGKLSNIDAQGSYITIVDPNDEWGLEDIQCYIKTDEVKEKVKTLSKDSLITVRGKVKDVGEIFGYSVDIDSID